jgi:hypothetical protein
MLDTLVQNKRTSPLAVGLDVDILSIATATPKNKVLQRDLVPHVKAMFPFIADIEEIFAHAGVDARYMCETEEWYSGSNARGLFIGTPSTLPRRSPATPSTRRASTCATSIWW